MGGGGGRRVYISGCVKGRLEGRGLKFLGKERVVGTEGHKFSAELVSSMSISKK